MNDKLKTPYVDLLPPLTTDEFAALKSDIKFNGVRIPIDVDEDGNILDGHHRYRIDKNAPTHVITGLSDAEKQAFVFRANFVRRNLSPDQKREATKRMKAVAAELRDENVKKWTQQRLAAAFGVARQTVDNWFNRDARANATCGNTSKPKPDARVKIAPEAKPIIAERVEAGESQSQVAADYGVSQRAVSTVCKQQEKQAAVKHARIEAAASRTTNCGVIHGDFRVGGLGDDDESFDLIFTDPPYDKKFTVDRIINESS